MNGVVFYADINYQGKSWSYDADVPFVGPDANDQFSSVKIPSGMTVVLFQDRDFGGQQLTLTSDTPDLRNFPGPGKKGNWNDAVSSIKFSGATTDPGPTDPGGGTVTPPAGAVRLKRGGRYVEARGTSIVMVDSPTDAGIVVLTKHDGNRFDALFVQANVQLSIQNDGSLQTRPAGTLAAYEMEQVFATSQPEGQNILYRNDGTRFFGEPILIEDAK